MTTRKELAQSRQRLRDLKNKVASLEDQLAKTQQPLLVEIAEARQENLSLNRRLSSVTAQRDAYQDATAALVRLLHVQRSGGA